MVMFTMAGFPYLWKQLLRVRPVGESSSLAVSESLGGLHPKASKCLSEDESQGIMDPMTKTIPGGMPCSSRDCEGDSPARKICSSFRSFDFMVSVPPVLIAFCELSHELCDVSF
jgi:hypothetical protein